ncbi:GDSL esterase/lipase At1g23500 [Euphorbia peplus]|nr:GDSL esterase/lipase At1g23500 [Euphorbia peplus]
MIILWIVFVLDFASGDEATNVSTAAVFAFGDSILDTGNNNNLRTMSKCNYTPYGRDLPGGFPTGRFCDGRVFSDLITEGLGVKRMLPAYLDPNLQPSDLLTGVCFASGGSGLDSITANVQSVLTVSNQLNMFREYISKLKTQVGEERSNSIISNAFFLISLGNNDIAFTYYSAHLRPQYDIASYTTLLVNLASDFVNELYGLGARRIGFMSTLPLGCLPAARAGGMLCNEFVNQAAQMFNSKLSTQLASLNTSLPQSNIVYLDVYTPLLNLVQNPQNFGFVVANMGCCCAGITSCPMPSSYVFWDFAHPTETSYRIIVNQTLANNSTYFLDFSPSLSFPV